MSNRFQSKALLSVCMGVWLLILSACGSAASNDAATAEAGAMPSVDSAETRVIQHEGGETSITGTPEKVVVLEYGLLSSVLALDVVPVGFPADDTMDTLTELGYDQVMEGFTSIGTRSQPSLELIRSLDPDLIIGDVTQHQAVYANLTDIAPTLLLRDRKAQYEDTISNQTIIGEALNKQDEAKAVIAEHQTRLDEVKALVTDSPNMLFVTLTEKETNARKSAQFQPSVLEAAGFNYVLQSADDDDTENKGSVEQLVAIAHDVLIIPNGDLVASWEQNPLWASIPSVKKDQLYIVDRSEWLLDRSLTGANRILDELKVMIPQMDI